MAFSTGLGRAKVQVIGAVVICSGFVQFSMSLGLADLGDGGIAVHCLQIELFAKPTAVALNGATIGGRWSLCSRPDSALHGCEQASLCRELDFEGCQRQVRRKDCRTGQERILLFLLFEPRTLGAVRAWRSKPWRSVLDRVVENSLRDADFAAVALLGAQPKPAAGQAFGRHDGRIFQALVVQA